MTDLRAGTARRNDSLTYDLLDQKYVTLKNPITGEIVYFKQLGSIYGETSAPALWERTIAS
jgi:hypothetical protein